MKIIRQIKTKLILALVWYRAKSPLIRFIINALGLCLIWLLFYHVLRYNALVHFFYETGTQFLTHSLLVTSQFFLNLMGYKTIIIGKIIQIVDTPGVLLDRGCLGRNLMGLYAGFLIAFPGKVFSKLWYIPMGLTVIYFLNVTRICLLALAFIYFPDTEIDHHAVYNNTVYVMVFLLWFIWIKKYGDINKR